MSEELKQYKRLGKGTLTDSLANIDSAAVPADHIRFVKAITLCNTDDSTCAVTITLAGTNVVHEYILPAVGGENTITIPFIDHVMVATERIQGVAETTAVVDYYLSGREFSIA